MSLAKQAYALAEKWDASRSTEDVSQLDFKESDLNGLDSNQISAYHIRRLLTTCSFSVYSRLPRTT